MRHDDAFVFPVAISWRSPGYGSWHVSNTWPHSNRRPTSWRDPASSKLLGVHDEDRTRQNSDHNRAPSPAGSVYRDRRPRRIRTLNILVIGRAFCVELEARRPLPRNRTATSRLSSACSAGELAGDRRGRRDCTDRVQFVGLPSPLGELPSVSKVPRRGISPTLSVEYRGAPPGLLDCSANEQRTALSRARDMNMYSWTRGESNPRWISPRRQPRARHGPDANRTRFRAATAPVSSSQHPSSIVGVTGIAPAASWSRTTRSTPELHPEIFVAPEGIEPSTSCI